VLVSRPGNCSTVGSFRQSVNEMPGFALHQAMILSHIFQFVPESSHYSKLPGAPVVQSAMRQAIGLERDVRFPAGVIDFSYVYSFQTGSGFISASFLIRTSGSFLKGKETAAEATPLTAICYRGQE
jgi:hypothetical protein